MPSLEDDVRTALEATRANSDLMAKMLATGEADPMAALAALFESEDPVELYQMVLVALMAQTKTLMDLSADMARVLDAVMEHIDFPYGRAE